MAMASSYHLRPVVESPSPSTSTTTSSDRTPPPRNGQSHVNLLPPASANRRPMSPTSIRDLDLSTTRRGGDTTTRIWPTPPTGHELMALFPPAPPMNIISGPTSGFFQREERAFFAQAGKEIVRVKIEVDMPHSPNDDNRGKSHLSRQNSRSSQFSPQSTPTGGSFNSSPNIRSNHQAPPFPHESSRTTRQGPVPLAVQPVYPASHPSGAAMAPPPLPPSHRPAYPIRSPTEDQQPHLHPPVGAHSVPGPMGDEYRDESDDSWRTPMPHNQRRRAGKHTRRVVVK
ncbi:hypothetical protein QCA50_008313 [Cerrena zonata]|uniref:Uncharacterized protein n=1 Tax=Cerrena zonata TaxID=2478898 RepID=A0AAW0GBS3_9APHY